MAVDNTTQPVVTTKSGTGWIIDVTLCNLDELLAVKDFIVQFDGEPQLVSDFEKTTRTALTYIGASIPSTEVTVFRNTAIERVQEITYGDRLQSALWEAELNRVHRKLWEAQAFEFSQNAVVGVSNDDAAASYLDSKLTAGTNITLNVLNPGSIESLEINAEDKQLKVSSDDSLAAFLEDKLVAGSNVQLVVNNPGASETITISSTDTDESVKISSNDTTAGYLDAKLVEGTNITLTENNDGSNESLTITAQDKFVGVTANDTTPDYLNGKLSTGANITFAITGGGSDETLVITSTDETIKCSANDTTQDYLEDKLVAGDNITLVTNNDGANETITISAADDTNTDETVKISGTDTTAGFLTDKLAAGDNISLVTSGGGANELLTVSSDDRKVKISINDTTEGFLNGKLIAGTAIDLTENNNGGNETLTVAVDESEITVDVVQDLYDGSTSEGISTSGWKQVHGQFITQAAPVVPPTLTQFATSFTGWGFSALDANAIGVNFVIPTDIDPNDTILLIRVNWQGGNTATGNVRFSLAYTRAKGFDQQNFATVATSAVTAAKNQTSQFYNYTDTLVTIPSSSTYHEPGSCIYTQLARLPLDAADTYAGGAIVHSVTLWYKSDREATKDNSPVFHT